MLKTIPHDYDNHMTCQSFGHSFDALWLCSNNQPSSSQGCLWNAAIKVLDMWFCMWGPQAISIFNSGSTLSCYTYGDVVYLLAYADRRLPLYNQPLKGYRHGINISLQMLYLMQHIQYICCIFKHKFPLLLFSSWFIWYFKDWTLGPPSAFQ